MQPFFDVTIDGQGGIASGLTSRNVSLTFTDNAGFENDKVSFVVDDDPPSIVPPKDTKIGVTIGYRDQPSADPRYAGVTQFCGTFYVDEVKFSKPPAQLAITAHANPTGNQFKKTKDRDWHQKKVGDILDKIAGENELTLRIDPAIADKLIDHIDQANVSDMQFVTTLSQRLGAVAKVAEGFLYVGEKGKLTSLAGEPLIPIVVHESECTTYSGLIQQRSVFSGVRARYNDLASGTEKIELFGEEGVTKTLPHRFATKQEAEDAAKGHMGDVSKEGETFSFTCVGNPRIVAETPIILSGFRPGIRTKWRADKVTHTLTASSYVTQVECKLPDIASLKSEVSGRS